MIITLKCVNLVWGTTREVTKRELMCVIWGLAARELGTWLKIGSVKNVSAVISRNALGVGDCSKWRKRWGKARHGPYYELQHFQINWCDFTSKITFTEMNDFKHGGLIKYKNGAEGEGTEVLKWLRSIRDIWWLISVGRLPVRAAVSSW